MDFVRIAKKVASRSDILGDLTRTWGYEGMPPDMTGSSEGPWTGTDDFGRSVVMSENVDGTVSIRVGEKSWTGKTAMEDAVSYMKSPPEDSAPVVRGVWKDPPLGDDPDAYGEVPEHDIANGIRKLKTGQSYEFIRVNTRSQNRGFQVTRNYDGTYGVWDPKTSLEDAKLGNFGTVEEVLETIKRDAEF